LEKDHANENSYGLEKLENEIRNCKGCRLHKTRTNAVPGAGSCSADIIFVGEGPGKNEDIHGLPFVGAAGKFLDELLQLISLSREKIFITNIVKCRPPGNRNPRPDEIEACLPYLRKQTRIIGPKLICTLGSPAGRTLVKKDLYISREHGSFHKKGDYHFCTLYHPAAALYNGSLKDVIKSDFANLSIFIKQMLPREESES